MYIRGPLKCHSNPAWPKADARAGAASRSINTSRCVCFLLNIYDRCLQAFHHHHPCAVCSARGLKAVATAGTISGASWLPFSCCKSHALQAERCPACHAACWQAGLQYLYRARTVGVCRCDDARASKLTCAGSSVAYLAAESGW